MKKYLLLLLAGCFLNCPPNPTHINYPFQFLFQSDVDGIGLQKLHIDLKADKAEQQISIDSIDFFTCPDTNDTCGRRIYWNEVPNYTRTVPMTNDYVFTAADGSVISTIILNDTIDTLFKQIISFDQLKRYGFILIFLGYSYDENNQKIKDFITCLKHNNSQIPGHLSFPISGTMANNDSLYLIWVD